MFCLGIGIDALNYVGDVLTVAVFDAEVFDLAFDGMVDQNDEGDVVGLSEADGSSLSTGRPSNVCRRLKPSPRVALPAFI